VGGSASGREAQRKKKDRAVEIFGGFHGGLSDKLGLGTGFDE